MKILILNGPNLNRLGKREPEIYGTQTLADIEALIRKTYPNLTITFFQSNYEGDLVEYIQRATEGEFDAVVANWAAYTHTSVAIYDALQQLTIPKVEVHLSNIHSREEFRERSLTGRAMNGIITGFGADSYLLGIEAASKLIHKKRESE